MDKVEILLQMRRFGLDEKSEPMLIDRLSMLSVQRLLADFIEQSPENVKTLALEVTTAAFLAITMDPDRIRAYLTVVPFEERMERLPQQVQALCNALRLKMDEVTDVVLQHLKRPNPHVHRILAQGTPAVREKSPTMTLHVKPFSGLPDYNELEDGSVDFRHPNLFQNVVANQHVGDYQPSVPGMPGVDVFFKVIPPPPPWSKGPSFGRGIVHDESDHSIFSTMEGYVVQDGERIWIEDTFTVHGDVNMEVGNLSFISDIEVSGDVMADFTVQAGANLTVHGSVAGSILDAKGDVKLHLGMLGHGKGHIRSGGKVTAKYLNDGVVEAQGKILLEKEALNSHLGCKGALLAPKAVVIGGRLASSQEIQVHTLGSELRIRTEVFIGEDYAELKKTESIRHRLLELEDWIDGVTESMAMDLDHWQQPVDDPDLYIESVASLVHRMDNYRERLNDYLLAAQEYELICHDGQDVGTPLCRVEKVVHAGTIFYCFGDVFRVREDIRGPVFIKGVPDPENQKLKIQIHR